MKVRIIKKTKKSTGPNYFKVGAVIEVSEKYGARLLAEGNAELINDTEDFLKHLETAALQQKFDEVIKPKRGRKKKTPAKD